MCFTNAHMSTADIIAAYAKYGIRDVTTSPCVIAIKTLRTPPTNATAPPTDIGVRRAWTRLLFAIPRHYPDP